jgi:hypothetical protein
MPRRAARTAVWPTDTGGCMTSGAGR